MWEEIRGVVTQQRQAVSVYVGARPASVRPLVARALMIGRRWCLLALPAGATTLADVTNTSLQSLIGLLLCVSPPELR